MACNCKCSDINKEYEVAIDLSKLDSIINKYSSIPGSLINVLQKAQDIYGYLPKEVLLHIAHGLEVKPAKVLGVVTFYSQFRLKPIGKYLLMVCQGTACHVSGSKKIQEVLVDELKIKPGETTTDRMFTLENVACLGCCSLAPVMMIREGGDSEVFGPLTPAKARKIIRDIYKRENVISQGVEIHES